MDRNEQLLTSTCTAAIAVEGGAPKWVQLFPAGTFKPVDGRGPWTLGDPAAVIAASKLPAPIDYDHGAERPANVSLNSRAAGWIEELATAGPEGQSGFWARVDWTPEGAKAVAAKEYRFLSPSFIHTKAGQITKVLRAALTNTPALELKALASIEQENSSVDPLAQIREALGLAATASAEEVISAIKALKSGSAAMCTQLASIATAAGVEVAKDKTVDETHVAAICSKIKTPVAGDKTTIEKLQGEVDTLQKSIATMQGERASDTATTKVDKAIEDRKLVPAQRDWAISYCSRDPKGFDDMIGKAPTILANGRTAPNSAADGELDDDQKAICSALGLDEKTFKADLAKKSKEKA
ncbi:MAG: phage protease [Rhizomicrobium sp.]